jgi:hypothetical protein
VSNIGINFDGPIDNSYEKFVHKWGNELVVINQASDKEFGSKKVSIFQVVDSRARESETLGCNGHPEKLATNDGAKKVFGDEEKLHFSSVRRSSKTLSTSVFSAEEKRRYRPGAGQTKARYETISAGQRIHRQVSIDCSEVRLLFDCFVSVLNNDMCSDRN